MVHDELQIKVVLNGIILGIGWLFTYLNLNIETMFLYSILLGLDYITGLAKSTTLKIPITYHRMRNGIVSKFCLLSVPIVLAILAKIVGTNYEFILSWGITILALSEGYSIISNIYTVKTKETLPEYEAIAIIGKKIRRIIERLEGDNNGNDKGTYK